MQQGQGTIEYLLIIAIVIVIGLVVVSMLVGIMNNNNTTQTTENLVFKSQEISILESTQTTGGYLALIIKSNKTEPITITNITTDNNTGTFNTIFQSQQEQTFVLYDSPCTAQQNTQTNITITYTTTQGLTKTQTYPVKLTTLCNDTSIAQKIKSNYKLSLTKIKNGLVAYYPLDTNYGDYSGNNNNGTAYGDTTITTGKIGNAITLDGNGDYIDTVDIDFPSALTVSAWFKGTDNSNEQVIVGQDVGSGRRFTLIYNSGSNRGYNYLYDPTSQIGSGTINNISREDWHNVVLVWESDLRYELYLDGSLGVENNVNAPLSLRSVNTVISIGRREYTGSNLDFNGSIDEVAIWSRVLTSEEILLLYNNGNGRSLIE